MERTEDQGLGDGEPLSPAAELFAGFLDRQADGAAEDLEALCAAHPEHAAALRRLHASWIELGELIGRDVAGALPEDIERTFGPGIDPSMALSAEPSAERALLEELAGQGARRRYLLLGEIGRGGMGAVLEVFDRSLRRTLAMKVLLGAPALGTGSRPEARALSRFLEEAQVTGQLEHPGIVSVHELGLDERGGVYFTMALVRGRRLDEVVALAREGREGWTLTRAVDVVLRACETLAYAHARGVVHRDLKPANIMVGRFGETYVLDWGLARVLGRADTRDLRLRPQVERAARPATLRSDAADTPGSPLLTMDGDVVGTPAYMPPEQAAGRVAEITARCDVYSLGAILYHVLTGCMPYLRPSERRSPHELLARVVMGPPRPLAELARGVPAELEAICEKAMARRPEDRYADTLEMAADLRAYLEGRVVRAYRTGAVAELRKWVRRNRTLAATLLASVAVITSGTAVAALVLAERNAELELARDDARDFSARLLGLSDAKRLELLARRADELWPPLPAHAEAYRAWLAEAEVLAARLDYAHRPALAELSASLPATTEAAWHLDRLSELVVALEELLAPERGLAASVERRLELAESVAELTVTGRLASELWREARASIADPSECPAYAGLELDAQLGLVPLGRDPRSGLWEFALLQSGEPPARDERTGELTLEPESAIVLVLLPGGKFSMGAQSVDPADPHYDLLAVPGENPVHPVELEPFFLAKHETTQAQWERATGANPSFYDPALGNIDPERQPLHPVERVTWSECVETLRRLGLVLPTEAQWEYAARGGTETPWWTGTDPLSLAGAANVADARAVEFGIPGADVSDVRELDDGHVVHAPVGSFRANPFGLHDVHGNVWELCRDEYLLYELAKPGPGDGLRSGDGTGGRTCRGGAFDVDARNARTSARAMAMPESAHNDLGVRAAREIERAGDGG